MTTLCSNGIRVWLNPGLKIARSDLQCFGQPLVTEAGSIAAMRRATVPPGDGAVARGVECVYTPTCPSLDEKRMIPPETTVWRIWRGTCCSTTSRSRDKHVEN